MSSTYTPPGYQLENTYDFPLNSSGTRQSVRVVIQRVDDDDNTVSCFATDIDEDVTNAAFTSTATASESAPTGYHYVYQFFDEISGGITPPKPSPTDGGGDTCVYDSTHIRVKYPDVYLAAFLEGVDIQQQQNDGSFVTLENITADTIVEFDPSQLPIYKFKYYNRSDSGASTSAPVVISTTCTVLARRGAGGGFWSLMR